MIIDAFKKGVETLNARGVDLDFMIIIYTPQVLHVPLYISIYPHVFMTMLMNCFTRSR